MSMFIVRQIDRCIHVLVLICFAQSCGLEFETWTLFQTRVAIIYST